MTRKEFLKSLVLFVAGLLFGERIFVSANENLKEARFYLSS